jgi:PhnB protein
MAKVSTYLNFPKTTENAFNFYKSVFQTEFAGAGIMRFGDMHSNPDFPSNPDVKHLVMHVELPIMGGHLLMGTDAPEEMGFNLHYGNNVHINVQPDTRMETRRLFDALCEGGKINIPLEDTAWGAYFGSCTDKFGINWMFNCNENAN